MACVCGYTYIRLHVCVCVNFFFVYIYKILFWLLKHISIYVHTHTINVCEERATDHNIEIERVRASERTTHNIYIDRRYVHPVLLAVVNCESISKAVVDCEFLIKSVRIFLRCTFLHFVDHYICAIYTKVIIILRQHRDNIINQSNHTDIYEIFFWIFCKRISCYNLRNFLEKFCKQIWCDFWRKTQGILNIFASKKYIGFSSTKIYVILCWTLSNFVPGSAELKRKF